jgi:hypothetical protein
MPFFVQFRLFGQCLGASRSMGRFDFEGIIRGFCFLYESGCECLARHKFRSWNAAIVWGNGVSERARPYIESAELAPVTGLPPATHRSLRIRVGPCECRRADGAVAYLATRGSPKATFGAV